MRVDGDRLGFPVRRAGQNQLPPGGHRLGPVPGWKRQCAIDGMEKFLRVILQRHLRAGLKGITLLVEQQIGACCGVDGALSGHRSVHGRAERVDVGPGALLIAVTGGVVLFEGRVAGGYEARQGARLHAQGQSRGTEIQQHGHAVFPQVDVAGFDIPVDEAGVVHELQPIEQRQENIFQRRLAAHLLELERVLETFPALVLHDHVGGVVGLEHAHDAHDVGVAKLRQRSRLG